MPQAAPAAPLASAEPTAITPQGSSTAVASAPAALAPCLEGTKEIPGGSLTADSRTIKIASFCMDTTEVTVAAYQRCVDARACTEPQAHDEHTYQDKCNWRAPGLEQHPINCVKWSQATAFCAWRGARLPLSEEWDWTARGGDQGAKFPWGDDPPTARRLNACGRECLTYQKRKHWPHPEALDAEDDGFVSTAPVGSFPAGANRWG